MEAFLQITRKRHETWHQNDKCFREALKKEKDRHESRKEHFGSRINPDNSTLPSRITSNSPPESMTKVERRTYQVLQASQKLLDESATRSKDNLNHIRPSTTSISDTISPIQTEKSSYAFNNRSLIVPMTQSIDFEEYNHLMNESLKGETFSDFVEHFIKFCPEFREQFAHFHQTNNRQNAVEKLKEFNQKYAKTKDQRFYNLINSLVDFHFEKK